MDKILIYLIICLWLCTLKWYKKLSEDDLKRVETCRSFEGLYV